VSPPLAAREVLLQSQVVTEAQLPVLGVGAVACACGEPDVLLTPPRGPLRATLDFLSRNSLLPSRIGPGTAMTHVRKNRFRTVIEHAAQGWRVALRAPARACRQPAAQAAVHMPPRQAALL
jgi:hypothetical protein